MTRECTTCSWVKNPNPPMKPLWGTVHAHQRQDSNNPPHTPTQNIKEYTETKTTQQTNTNLGKPRDLRSSDGRISTSLLLRLPPTSSSSSGSVARHPPTLQKPNRGKLLKIWRELQNRLPGTQTGTQAGQCRSRTKRSEWGRETIRTEKAVEDLGSARCETHLYMRKWRSPLDVCRPQRGPGGGSRWQPPWSVPIWGPRRLIFRANHCKGLYFQVRIFFQGVTSHKCHHWGEQFCLDRHWRIVASRVGIIQCRLH